MTLTSLPYPYPMNIIHNPSKRNDHARDGACVNALSMKRNTHLRNKHVKRKSLMYLSLLLIANSSDVELNSGPRSPKYPCQICHRAVTWKQRGVDCEKWYYVDCMHMSTEVYEALHNVSWHCVTCGMPNFSSSLFDSTVIKTSNTFSNIDKFPYWMQFIQQLNYQSRPTPVLLIACTLW